MRSAKMDGWVRVLRPFNSISVISRRWKGEHERLCAMKRRLGSGRILPPAGFEPATPWSEVGSANRSATRTLRSAKTQISLSIRPVWSESSLSGWRKLGSLATHWAHSEDSGQTGWTPRLIWVFTWRTCHFVGFVMRWLNYSSGALSIIWDVPMQVPKYCKSLPCIFHYRHPVMGIPTW